MADEWATADTFDATKLNRKTRFVGTSAQAVAFITSPQIGQMIFSTSSTAHSDTFTHDKLAVYNSSSSWVNPNVDESTEYSDGELVDPTSSIGSANFRYYRFFTLPTTEKFYVITGFAASQGSGADTVIFGASIVNSLTPTINHEMLCAVSSTVSLAGGGSGTATTSIVASDIIRGGTILGYWIHLSVGNSVLQGSSGTQYKKSITYTVSPPTGENTAFTTSAAPLPAIKIYYRGYV